MVAKDLNLKSENEGISRRTALGAIGLALASAALPRIVHGIDRSATIADAEGLALEMRRAIADTRLKLGYPIDSQFDPAGSGVIGLPSSPVTSLPGQLADKQASLSRELIPWLVDTLTEIGIKRGDRVAICWSGSYPAANIAVTAVLQRMGVQSVSIASAAASQFGANIPGLLWLDMEQILSGVLQFGSVAASIGGAGDLGKNIESPELLKASILRSGIQLISPQTVLEAVEKRLEIYSKHAVGPRAADAFINVGGGVAAIGGRRGRILPLGLFPASSSRADFDEAPDCVALRFHRAGTPVINLRAFRQLGKYYHATAI